MKTLIDSTRFTVGFQTLHIKDTARCSIALFPKDAPNVTIQIVFDKRANEDYNVRYILINDAAGANSTTLGFNEECFRVAVLQTREVKHKIAGGPNTSVVRKDGTTVVTHANEIHGTDFLGFDLDIGKYEHASDVIRKLFCGHFGPRWSKLKAECDKQSADDSPYFYVKFG